MNETKPVRMISRRVAFALAIACILLVAGLGSRGILHKGS
jgi:hypothetical protein